jgi:hypothetical protein
MIYGPKSDGTYIIDFRMADGETLAISVPAGETRELKRFQARMPYGLVVPDVPQGTFGTPREFAKRSPRNIVRPHLRVPETPPFSLSGGVIVWRTTPQLASSL